MAADGTVVRYGAGPALVLSFVLLGAVCALAGLCYAELTSMIPISGSAYTYAYATLGELVAWIIGWDLILEYAVGNVAVAIAWSGYFASLLALLRDRLPVLALARLPRRAALEPRPPGRAAAASSATPSRSTCPGIVIVALITWVLVLGIRESARVNNVMVVIKLAVLALFVGVGRLLHRPGATGRPSRRTAGAGIHQGAAIVFFAYIGFDADLDRGRGDEGPAAQHAHRHPRLARPSAR